MKQIVIFFVVTLLVSGCTQPKQPVEISALTPPTEDNGKTFDPIKKPAKPLPVVKKQGNSNSSYKALVIGNSDYDYSQLQNPVNDAKAMTKKLLDMKFHVTQATNLDHTKMQETIQEFEQSLSKQDVAFFYFSGHGAQVNGKNFLIPVNNNGINEKNLENTAVSAQNVLAMMEDANKGMNILILDACRNNPYVGSTRVGLSRGLARISPPRGALIAFATEPGGIAFDGDGVNGLYTTYLLKALNKAKNKRIVDVFMEIRNPVEEDSGGTQKPWYQASLSKPFCFGGCR